MTGAPRAASMERMRRPAGFSGRGILAPSSSYRRASLLLSFLCLGLFAWAEDAATADASRSFAEFKILGERNIFDSERVPYRPPAVATPMPRPEETERIVLLGTLIDGSERVAFVEGTRSDCPKTLRPGDKIAGLLVSGISTDGVRIEQSTRTLQLRVGSELERKGQGPWETGDAGTSRASAVSAPSASPAPSASSGAASDVLKRLMERRQKEIEK